MEYSLLPLISLLQHKKRENEKKVQFFHCFLFLSVFIYFSFFFSYLFCNIFFFLTSPIKREVEEKEYSYFSRFRSLFFFLFFENKGNSSKETIKEEKKKEDKTKNKETRKKKRKKTMIEEQKIQFFFFKSFLSFLIDFFLFQIAELEGLLNSPLFS